MSVPAVMVAVIVVVPVPPVELTPYHTSSSPAAAVPPAAPLTQATPPPVTVDTVGSDVLRLSATINTRASPAVTFAGRVTVIED